MFEFFSVRDRVDGIERGFNNPNGFSFSRARDILVEILGLLFAPGGILMILCFLWGYTNVFGGDSGFARFIFWILLILNGILFVIIRIVVNSMRQMKGRIAIQKKPTNKDVYVTYDAEGKRIKEND